MSSLPNEEVRNFPEARQRSLAIPRAHLLTHQKSSAVGRSLQILAPPRSGMTRFRPAPAPELCRHKALTEQHQQQPAQRDRGFLVELSMLVAPGHGGAEAKKAPPARSIAICEAPALKGRHTPPIPHSTPTPSLVSSSCYSEPSTIPHTSLWLPVEQGDTWLFYLGLLHLSGDNSWIFKRNADKFSFHQQSKLTP